MQQNFKTMLGNASSAAKAHPLRIFDDRVIAFLHCISQKILKSKDMQKYKDLTSIAFFIRKASLEKIKLEYKADNRIGIGLAFHVSPSNIPVQFFYSFVVSILAGNSNIIRVPNKEFEQTTILYRLLEETLQDYSDLKSYLCLVQYGHEREINDEFSKKCDVRIIWGGDQSILQIRESKLQARAYDLTFADRFSICLIDARKYLEISEEIRQKMADNFYVDTYFSDQNACNSSRMVVWIGKRDDYIIAAKHFWKLVYKNAKSQYSLNSISAIDKLIKSCSTAIETSARYSYSNSCENYVNVVELLNIPDNISELKGNSGFYFQVNLENKRALFRHIKKDWQTMTYFGFDKKELLNDIFKYGVKGIDRITPIGQSGNPSIQWDGIDFIERLSRKINVL